MFVGMDGIMMSLASTDRVLAALRGSKSIACMAYTLPHGAVLNGLIAAARRGAHVVVQLEGSPYKDVSGGLQRANAAIVAALREAGADARLVDGPGSSTAPVHAKAIIADGVAYIDDCNWLRGGQDTIVRDDARTHVRLLEDAMAGTRVSVSATFATHKRDALALEARLIDGAQQRLDIESESASDYNSAYHALAARAKAGGVVRFLVCERDLRDNPKERAALIKLMGDGVRVRTCADTEKFALDGTRAWIGSANASAAFDKPDQIDTGLLTHVRSIVRALNEHFNARWRSAAPLRIADLEERPRASVGLRHHLIERTFE